MKLKGLNGFMNTIIIGLCLKNVIVYVVKSLSNLKLKFNFGNNNNNNNNNKIIIAN